jgi:hypothetical protein
MNTYNTTATVYYKNTALSWWERLSAAINNGCMVLLQYSRLKAFSGYLTEPAEITEFFDFSLRPPAGA